MTSDGIEPPLSDLESEVLPLHHEACATKTIIPPQAGKEGSAQRRVRPANPHLSKASRTAGEPLWALANLSQLDVSGSCSSVGRASL